MAGVGPKLEQGLWRQSVTRWEALEPMIARGRLSATWRRALPEISRSREALKRGDSRFFYERLPSAKRWRLYDDFARHAGYVDIETTGLSRDRDAVTVIGLYTNGRFRTFVRGKNLREFPKAVARVRLLVSYGGAQFDLPFLQRTFPSFTPPPQLDLRFPLARLGFAGGLKNVEAAIGIKRPRHLRHIDGFAAMLLWKQYERGDRQALKLLIEYLRQDVLNLVSLAQATSAGMWTRLGF